MTLPSVQAVSKVNHWHTEYLAHPLYQPVSAFARLLSLPDWPGQPEYDSLLQQARSGSFLPDNLRFCCDLAAADYYEKHIGDTGEVPTRSRNWHDWFNALAWLAWPHSKAALNARHVRAIQRGEVQRGPRRDAATLLDECGIIVACANPALGQALDNMQWQQLFVDQRAAWGRQIAAYTLGHAIFEVGLQPHIGWCGKALLLEVDEAFFCWDETAQRQHLDTRLAALLADDNWLISPRQLWPLPLLGIPGWWPANENPAFYDNTDYFRPSRRAKSSSVTC